MKKIISIITLLAVATISNATTLAQLGEGVTQQNLTEKYNAIKANETNFSVLIGSYNSIIAGDINITELTAGERALVVRYMCWFIQTVSTENAHIFASYAPHYFARNASDELFSSELAKMTGTQKATMQVLRKVDAWGIDQNYVGSTESDDYVSLLIANQGTKTNQEMLEKMVSLTTLFKGKEYTNGYQSASEAMATYYAAVKALK